MARKIIKVIKSPKGFSISNIEVDPTATKRITIIFRKRSRLGALLRIKKRKTIKIPRGLRLVLFENNRPVVRSGTFVFKKR